jgi:hypothetical protein
MYSHAQIQSLYQYWEGTCVKPERWAWGLISNFSRQHMDNGFIEIFRYKTLLQGHRPLIGAGYGGTSRRGSLDDRG